MDWFVEYYNGSALMIKVKRKVYEHRGLQLIQIFETVDFGKMLVLDGKVQLTERDEAFYHEMLVHPAMIMHEDPSKVLVIGGGDGGTVREVLKHDPEEVVMVEIDREVIESCRRFIGIDRGALDDGRVTIINEDGVEFVKGSDERFDVVIVDGTDPNPVSRSLVSKEFYASCGRISDYFVTQSQSPFIQREYFEAILKNARFENRRLYIGFVPTYPLGLWSYLLGSNNRKIELDLDTIRERFEERRIDTVYYTPDVHIAAFSLPKWLEELTKKFIA
jgi:spermidine synthase